MWRNKLVTIVFLGTIQLSMAQEVNSKAYDIMLSTMLSHSVDEIDVKGASQEKSPLFIDSRSKAEFDTSHLKDAVWVGYENADLSKLEGISKNQSIIVYCSVGYRSEKIAEQLKKKGFENVKNLYGGIFEWVNQDGQVVDAEGKPTKKVHAYNRMWGVWLNKGEKVY